MDGLFDLRSRVQTQDTAQRASRTPRRRTPSFRASREAPIPAGMKASHDIGTKRSGVIVVALVVMLALAAGAESRDARVLAFAQDGAAYAWVTAPCTAHVRTSASAKTVEAVVPFNAVQCPFLGPRGESSCSSAGVPPVARRAAGDQFRHGGERLDAGTAGSLGGRPDPGLLQRPRELRRRDRCRRRDCRVRRGRRRGDQLLTEQLRQPRRGRPPGGALPDV